MKKLIIIFSLFLLFFYAGNILAISEAEEISLEIRPVQVSVTKDAKGYAKFSDKNIQYLTKSGEPAIPYHSIRVLLPPDANLATVAVSIENQRVEVVSGQWNVLPIPPLSYWDGTKVITEWPEGKTIENGRDIGIYNKDALFPTSLIGRASTGNKRTWLLVEVPIASHLYNPITGKLYQLVEAKLVVTFSRCVGFRSTPAPNTGLTGRTAEKIIRKLTINFDQVAPSYRMMAPSVVAAEPKSGYVIITTNEIQSGSSGLANFINSKEQRGFDVEVVTQNTWGGGTGDTAAENIRNWLKANYLQLNLEYLLLIGNPHPNDGDVPMKVLYPRHNQTGQLCPTDAYYSELTGNWDLDGDGVYGEKDDDFGPGGMDRFLELFVGRIPHYGDFEALDHILSKIIAYENTEPSDADWRKNVLIAMEPVDSVTPGYHLGEAVKDDIILPKGDWGFHRVYEQDYGLDPLPETIPTTVENVTNAWKGSHFGAVFWFTHGGPRNANDVMDIDHAQQLNDTYPSFTFQASCSNAEPEDSSNLAFTLLKNGCIGTLAGTKVTFYWQGQTNFAGTWSIQGLLYEYAKRLVGAMMDSGYSWHNLKETLFSPDSFENLILYNIYGDPSLGLFSYIPGQPLTINVPSGDVAALKAAINRGNGSIYGAIITLEAGTYTLTTVDNETGGPNGLPTIGSPITIKNAGAAVIERDVGSPQFRILYVAEGGSLTLDGITIKGGDVNSWGGGIHNDGGKLNVTNCTFLENKARSLVEPERYRGGGICNLNSIAFIYNCIFLNNHAGYSGGGIYNHNSLVTITNCTFNNNQTREGGGILNTSSPSIITHCTFTNNYASSDGGGIYNDRSFSTITNCIFWGNNATTRPEISIYGVETPIISYCDIDQDGFAGIDGNIRQDPLFSDPDNDDFHLSVNSPCIDTGTDAGVYYDMDGDFRPLGSGFDIGADEFFGPVLYSPVTPCRIVDTRKAGSAIHPGAIRGYNVWGDVASQGGNPSGCPSPSGEPYGVHINVTVVPVTGAGNILAYPFGSAAPTASMVNYKSGAQNIANGGTVKTCYNCDKDINIKSNYGTAHVVIDVLGYYFENPWH